MPSPSRPNPAGSGFPEPWAAPPPRQPYQKNQHLREGPPTLPRPPPLRRTQDPDRALRRRPPHHPRSECPQRQREFAAQGFEGGDKDRGAGGAGGVDGGG